MVADREHALTVSMRQGMQPVMHLGVLGLDRDSFVGDDVITAGLSNVNVATAGYLQPVKGSKVRFEPLLLLEHRVRGAAGGALQDAVRPGQPARWLQAERPAYTLAARVTGMVHSAFPAGPPAGVQLAAGQLDLKESSKPLNLVVFADTDMLSDYLWVHQPDFFGQRMTQALASNGDLVQNALDNLVGQRRPHQRARPRLLQPPVRARRQAAPRRR